jgi:hypothetical protein
MADPLRSPEDTNAPRGSDPGSPNGRPRWALVVSIVIAIALLGLIIFLHVSGAIGPGIH